MTQSLDIIRPLSVEVRRVTADDDHDAIAEKLMAMEAIWQWAKEAKAAIEQSAIERIKELGKPIRVGEMLYWVGTEKKNPKCVNVPATMEALLKATDGDLEKVWQCLSANAVKHGAASHTLPPEEFARLFNQETQDKLKSGPAAEVEKKLMSAPIAILEGKR